MRATARRFHERQLTDAPSAIADLIHEDAEMTLFVSHLRTVYGRESVMAALRKGREAEEYSAEVYDCQPIDDRTLVVRGQARYALEGSGFTVSRVWWLDEFCDGLLWRVQGFRTEKAVLRARRRPARRSSLTRSRLSAV